jgi:hypothetical protein
MAKLAMTLELCADPFYRQFLKEMEAEDVAASKGPTVTATTTIEEQPEKPAIVTPLMQHVIDAHTPKPASSSRQRATREKRDRREKENHKRSQALPTIEEGQNRAAARDAGKGEAGHARTGKERKPGVPPQVVCKPAAQPLRSCADCSASTPLSWPTLADMARHALLHHARDATAAACRSRQGGRGGDEGGQRQGRQGRQPVDQARCNTR